jgi:hypothetical protein
MRKDEGLSLIYYHLYFLFCVLVLGIGRLTVMKVVGTYTVQLLRTDQ